MPRVPAFVVQQLQPSPSVITVILDWGCTLVCYCEVVPDIRMRGCHFHWSRVVWLKVQYLAVAYMEDAKTHKFILLFFCLPFLPAEKIQLVLPLDTPASPMPHSPCQHGYTASSGLQWAGLYLTAASKQIMTVRADTDDQNPPTQPAILSAR